MARDITKLNQTRLKEYRRSLIARIGGLEHNSMTDIPEYPKLQAELARVRQEIFLRRQMEDSRKLNPADVEATEVKHQRYANQP
jgi:ribosomal 50S subunit-associated protein YjgA (DUF615 family)